MFQKDLGSVFPENGIVEIDHERKLVRRSLPTNRLWYIDFLKSDVYYEAVEKGMLPKATLSKYTREKNRYWLDVKYIDFITRPNEWCGTQVVAAIQMAAKLQEMVVKHKWRGRDAAGETYFVRFPHLLNISFDPQPIMFDIGDISVACKDKGKLLITGNLISSKIENWETISNRLKNIVLTGTSAIDVIERASDIYKSLKPIDRSGAWSDYGKRTPPAPGIGFGKNTKVHKQKGITLLNVLKQKKPKTAIDFGSHRGYFSFMAASLGTKTLGMELCEDAVADAYNTAKQRKDDCSFVTVNLLKLPKAMGLDGRQRHILNRIKAEAGFAPAILHHLVRAGATFADLATMFDKFVKDWFMIEFPPREDIHVQNWGMPEWYTEENLRSALGKYWNKITTLPSGPSPRVWLLCER